MQLTLGKRISHEAGHCHPCLPTDLGAMTKKDGWETGSDASCHDDRGSGVIPAPRAVHAGSSSGVTVTPGLVVNEDLSSGVTPALGLVTAAQTNVTVFPALIADRLKEIGDGPD